MAQQDGKLEKGKLGKNKQGGSQHHNVAQDLFEVAHDFPPGAIRFSDIVASLGARSFGLVVLIFSVPMIIPMPPGIPMAAGALILTLGFQLVIGHQHLWLPNGIGQKTIDRDKLIKGYAFAERYVGWMLRMARPRLPQLTGPLIRRITGALFVVLGFLMVLPIPFIGNIVPAFACTVLALGLTDRDGVFYIVGISLAIIAIILTVLMGAAALKVLSALF